MRDPQLRRCSLAAKGLWIELLCLMHQMPTRGVLRDESGAAWLREDVIAAVNGATNELLDQLLRAGVLKQGKRTGTFFCRRMLLDHVAYRRKARSGKEGGSKPKANRKQSGSKPKANTKAKRGSSTSSSTSSSERDYSHANEPPERDGPDGHFSRADELAFVIEWNALADRFPTQLVRHGSTELNKFDRDALAGRWAGTWAEDWPRFVARLEAGKLQKTAVTVKQVLQNDLMDREIAQDRPGIDDRGAGRVRRRPKRPASTTERPHANLDDEDLTIKIETTERFIGLLEAETSPTAEQLGKLTRAHAKIAELRAERDARRDEESKPEANAKQTGSKSKAVAEVGAA